MKYQCNNCKKEFEIPGELETITVSNYSPPTPLGAPINVYKFSPITTTIRKSICPHCENLDFHELKEG